MPPELEVRGSHVDVRHCGWLPRTSGWGAFRFVPHSACVHCGSRAGKYAMHARAAQKGVEVCVC